VGARYWRASASLTATIIRIPTYHHNPTDPSSALRHKADLLTPYRFLVTRSLALTAALLLHGILYRLAYVTGRYSYGLVAHAALLHDTATSPPAPDITADGRAG